MCAMLVGWRTRHDYYLHLSYKRGMPHTSLTQTPLNQYVLDLEHAHLDLQRTGTAPHPIL